jgi:hypothetical protein
MRLLKITALFFTPTSKKVEPKNTAQETLKNGLRSALPAAVNRNGAHKSVAAFSCLPPDFETCFRLVQY